MADQYNSISYNNWNIYNASFNSINMHCLPNASPSSSASSFPSSLIASNPTDYYNYYNNSSSSPCSLTQNNYLSNFINSPNSTHNYHHSMVTNNGLNYNINYDSSLLNNSSGYSSINSSFNNSPNFSTARQSILNSNTSPIDNYQYQAHLPQKRKINESNKENETEFNSTTKKPKNDQSTNEIILSDKIFPLTPINPIEKTKRKYTKKSKINQSEENQPTSITSANNDKNDYKINKLIDNSFSKENLLLVENENDDIDLDDFDYDDNNDEFNNLNWQNDESYDSLSNNNGQMMREKKKRVLTKSQRVAANQRERKRMNIMNESFDKLRQVLPISTGRKRRKMSRLDIVCGAMEYIAYLDLLLKSDEPCEIDFESYITEQYMSFI